MAKSRNRQIDYLTYLLARLGVMLVQMFPLWLNYWGARIVGRLLYRFGHTHRRRTLGHLRRSYPAWSQRERERVARLCARNLAYVAVEILLAPRLVRVESRKRLFKLVDMEQTVRMLVLRNTGLLLLTGHFGNWEVAGYMTAAIGLPTETVARDIKNKYMNRYVLSLREKAGQRIIGKLGATGDVSDAIERHKSVSVVFDQDAGEKGIFVDYFGRKASTFKSIGLLAMLYEIPIVVLYCRRLDERYHFEVRAHRTIYPREWADKPDPLMWVTQEYTRGLEQVVRSDPGQYFWLHRRWKTRPPGEQRGTDGVS